LNKKTIKYAILVKERATIEEDHRNKKIAVT
jgi:hypothetical protein